MKWRKNNGDKGPDARVIGKLKMTAVLQAGGNGATSGLFKPMLSNLVDANASVMAKVELLQQAAQILVEPVMGAIIHRFGVWKPYAAVGAVNGLMLVAMSLLTLSSAVTVPMAMAALVLGNVFLWAGKTALYASALTAVSKKKTEEASAEIIAVEQSVGEIVSPLGSLLALTTQIPLLIGACAAFLIPVTIRQARKLQAVEESVGEEIAPQRSSVRASLLKTVGSLWEGTVGLLRTPTGRYLSVIAFVLSLCVGGYFAVLFSFAVNGLGLSAVLFQVVFMTYGVGSFFGPKIATRLRTRIGSPNVIRFVMALHGCVFLTLVFGGHVLPHLLVALAVVVAAGVGDAGWDFVKQLVLRDVVAEEESGRALASIMMLGSIASTTGVYVTTYLLLPHMSVPAAVQVWAGVIFGVLILGWPLIGRIRTRGERA